MEIVRVTHATRARDASKYKNHPIDLKISGMGLLGMGITNMTTSLKETERSKVKFFKMAETWWEGVIEYGDHEYRHGVKGGGGSKVKFFKVAGNGSKHSVGTLVGFIGRAAAFLSFWPRSDARAPAHYPWPRSGTTNLAAQRCPFPHTLPRAAKRPCLGIWPRSDARAPTHYPVYTGSWPRSGLTRSTRVGQMAAQRPIAVYTGRSNGRAAAYSGLHW